MDTLGPGLRLQGYDRCGREQPDSPWPLPKPAKITRTNRRRLSVISRWLIDGRKARRYRQSRAISQAAHDLGPSRLPAATEAGPCFSILSALHTFAHACIEPVTTISSTAGAATSMAESVLRDHRNFRQLRIV